VSGRRLGLDFEPLSSDTRQMGLDEDLVREAEAARARLIRTQLDAERARAEYHHAVRRLHAAGGSLREIAEVLRLSHQRVHQIVEAAEPARPWWRGLGRRGPARPCSFCGRSGQESARLVAGPRVCICDRCVTDARRMGAGAPVEDRVEAPLRLEPPGSKVRCGFCGRQAGQAEFLVASGLAGAPGGKPDQGTRICDQCLDLCLEILAEPSSRGPTST
jgi:hypothetical protein